MRGIRPSLRWPLVAGLATLALAPPTRAQVADTTRHDSTSVRPMTHDSTARDTLAHRAYTLPAVRVVGERTRRADAASGVVIQPMAIRTAPATNAWDIVRQTAGVEVHQQGQGPGFASDAVMRGFTSDHSSDVALMVDGMPINEPVNGHAEGYADWNVILPEAVSAIRVRKGPVSPWVGNFAMGGEVEVETLPLTLGTTWALRTGSYGDVRASVLTGDAGEGGGYAFAAAAQREDGWRHNSESSTEHGYFNRTWLASGDRTWSLGVSGYGAQWNSPGFVSLAQFDTGDVKQAVDPTDGGALGFGAIRGSLKQPLAGGTLESLLYGRGGDWHIYLHIPPEGGVGEGALAQTEERDTRFGGGGYTRWSKQMGAAHLMFGLQYRGEHADYGRWFTTARSRDSLFYFDDVSSTLAATYLAAAPTVEAHWDVTPMFSLGLGGRVDWLRYATHPRNGGAEASHDRVLATPKLSALYHVTSALSAYAAFNGGFRSADGSVADPTLEPSREWASEVGARLDADRFEGSLALFQVNVRNEQTINPVTLEATANGTSRRRGVELDGRAALTRQWALFTHATFNDAKYLRLISDEGEDLSGTNVFGVARETVEGGVDFDTHGVRGSVWAAYTGPFTPIDEPDVRTASYTLLHLRGVVPIARRWSIELGVENLLDRRYAEVRASGFVSPGQPRTMLVTVRHGAP